MIEKFIENVEVTKNVKEVVPKEKFRCSDGKTFFSEVEATDWENLLDIKEKIKHINRIQVDSLDIGNIGTTRDGKAYYITTKEEMDLVCAYQNKTDGYLYNKGFNGSWDSKLFTGPDWYIFYWEENDNSRDSYWTERFSDQKKEIEDYLTKFKEAE